MTIFVGNLPYELSEDVLHSHFKGFPIRKTTIIAEKGFAFITLMIETDESKVIKAYHQSELGKRKLIVTKARQKYRKRRRKSKKKI
jgi:RNA recognition motif-containing protein